MYRSIIVMIGETTPAVAPAAVMSEAMRHGRASVFQVGFWRESTLTGVGVEGRDERLTS